MKQPEAQQAQEKETLRSRARRKIGILACAAAGVLGGTYAASESGLLDKQYVPEVPAYEGITQGIIAANEVLREVSPAVALGAIAALGAVEVASRRSKRWNAIDKYSRVEYSAQLSTVAQNKGLRKYARTAAGTAALGTVFIAASAGIEHEVADKGPNRTTETVSEALFDDAENNRFYLTQDENSMFMLDSEVNYPLAQEFKAKVEDAGGGVEPFYIGLPSTSPEDESSKYSLILAMPAEKYGMTERPEGVVDCDNVPVIVDESARLEEGKRLDVNNAFNGYVAGEISDASFMGRSFIGISNEDFAACYKDRPQHPYWGAAVSGIEQSEAQEILEEVSPEGEAVLLSEKELLDNNREFWRANVTPLVVQMMGYIAGFGFVANRNERKGSLQRDIKEIATLNALGNRIKTLRNVERLRALRETTVAAGFAGVIAQSLPFLTNSMQEGLRVGIGLRELAVGYTIALGARVVSASRAVSKFGKEVTPGNGMRG